MRCEPEVAALRTWQRKWTEMNQVSWGGEVAVVVAVVVPVVVVALRAWQREWTEINQVSLGRGAVAVVAVVVVALRA